MREVKFKIVDKNCMEYADGVFNIHDIKNISDTSHWIFLQYTGLKDKNGKEIYESDIIKQSDDLGREVILYEGCWMLNNHFALYDYELENIEVIGNIYENSELLK